MNKKDQIKFFFDEKCQDIRNNDVFVRRVLNQLPERKSVFSEHIGLITSALATVLCLIAANIWGYELIQEVMNSLIHGVWPSADIFIIPVVVIIVFIFCLYELVYTLKEDL